MQKIVGRLGVSQNMRFGPIMTFSFSNPEAPACERWKQAFSTPTDKISQRDRAATVSHGDNELAL